MGPKAVKSLHELAKECTCTIGEFLVGAFVVLNPEYKHLCDIKEISMSKISELQKEFEKLKLVINLFGTLYFQSKEKDVLELIDIILERTKYVQWFDDGTEQSDMKKENLTELKNVAYTYVSKFGKQSLEMFLNEINLIEQEQDKNQDGSGNYVNLMTLHSSKGLEFDYVFLIGMEEGLLPHSRAFIEEKELEEERRLCYVGITRAKQKLYLTFAENRLTREGYSTQLPSRFLGEIPQNLCEYYSWNA